MPLTREEPAPDSEPDPEPPTEPLPADAKTNPAYFPPIAPPPAVAPVPPAGPFASTIYRFTTGLRAGEIAHVRDANDKVVLTYRSFATVVGVVAALVCGIVLLAGIAGTLFLIAEESLLRAALVLVLTVAFATFIGILVPRANVTLYDDANPALTISQRSVFPSANYVVTTPNGATLAMLGKSFLSRLGRNRWTIVQDGRFVGDAAEESLGGALVRKVLGKFSRRFETNVTIEYGGVPAGRIVRRPAPQQQVDVLELTTDALDRRVAVALATLILGREP